MPDYSNSRIYKIVDNTNGNIYIGSTTQTLSRRLAKHTSDYGSYLNDKCRFMTSFNIIQNGNYEIILIENVNCETKEQLYARERFHIENNICVNKVIPMRIEGESKKIYYKNNKKEILTKQKHYYEANKEHISEREKNKYEINKEKIKERVNLYRENNKETITEKKATKYMCKCGKEYTNCHKSRHEKTQFHQKFLNENEPVVLVE